jgi:hypothetical protein
MERSCFNCALSVPNGTEIIPNSPSNAHANSNTTPTGNPSTVGTIKSAGAGADVAEAEKRNRKKQEMMILRGRNDAYTVLCADCLAHFTMAWLARLKEALKTGYSTLCLGESSPQHPRASCDASGGSAPQQTWRTSAPSGAMHAPTNQPLQPPRGTTTHHARTAAQQEEQQQHAKRAHVMQCLRDAKDQMNAQVRTNFLTRLYVSISGLVTK